MSVQRLSIIALSSVLLAGCNLVSESLLVKNKSYLENPPSNSVPAPMQGTSYVSTPQSMKNRFSYYGIDHAE